jgi:hypothetical protein
LSWGENLNQPSHIELQVLRYMRVNFWHGFGLGFVEKLPNGIGSAFSSNSEGQNFFFGNSVLATQEVSLSL